MTKRPLPIDRPAPEGALAVWVIYHRPKDYPDGYVLRCQYAMPGGTTEISKDAWFGDTLESLRAIVPPGLVRMSRHPNDEPHIVETWI